MTFTSIEFVIFFIVVYGALTIFRNDIARRWILLVASFAFYAYWNVWFVFLMMAVILWSWWCGLLIADSTTMPQRKLWVGVGVALSLSALAVFKYAGFISSNVAMLTGGSVSAFVLHIGLPIGISFYTFHSISYYVDVYRNHIPATRSLRDYSLYIAFFPQLVAGPIVRASQFLPQLDRLVQFTRADFSAGLRLVLIGAIQKLLIADQVSPFVDRIFENPTLYSTPTEWLAVLSYAIQIFGDFSGYTLMAIGIARMFGYVLPENFRMPYISTSIVEFWRRWHITLSFFLRDYLYIALGGNRRGFSHTQLNVLVTMLLGGLWHGASWNFVLWGGLHGLAIVVNNLWCRFGQGRKLPSPLAWVLTIGFVMLAWIPFRAGQFEESVEILRRLFQPSPGIHWFHTPSVVALMAVVVWHVMYVTNAGQRVSALVGPRWNYGFDVAMASALLLFAPIESNPFIYFQF